MSFEVSPTKYAHVGDDQVAFKVIGEGPPDLLYFFGLGSHVDNFFDDPGARGWISGLASLGRLINFDRRGTGASERVRGDFVPTWEEWGEDVGAVLDAVGSRRTVLFAGLDAGPIAALFAAKHPERVESLILANTSARYLLADDYPIGFSETHLENMVAIVRELWGTEEITELVAPSLAEDVRWRQENAQRLRAAASPANAAMQYDHLLHRDIRSYLSLIQAPTLVLHTVDNPLVPPSHGRYLADHIEGAKFVELNGSGIGFDDCTAEALGTVAEFVTGQPPSIEIDRCLAAVLMTDIVASTDYLVGVGDRQWHETLDAHDRIVRERLRRFGGQESNTTGDGFVAFFDGAARAVRCAREITQAVRPLDIEVRTGLHIGECEIRRDGLAGLTVHVAARVCALAGANEVLVTEQLREVIDGSGIELTSRGATSLKGVPGTWQLYALQDLDPAAETLVNPAND
jgi:class 3 adenylate cyclase/pimeloyl-ACP methyl ester carboxylesterase